MDVRRRAAIDRVRGVVPGLLFCAFLAALANAVAAGEAGWFGHVWLEPVALSILIGIGVRNLTADNTVIRHGVQFASKTILELAVALLGATVSVQVLGKTGPLLVCGIVAAVVLSILASYSIGRGLGLPRKLATLVACGNSICGNSAIAAVAPLIEADGSDVAAAVAFTALLGVLVVIGLPFLAPVLHLKPFAYGVLAGLTVYAVPQVVAATAPLGAVAMQIGALVKLMRVLMLAPVLTLVAAAGHAFPEQAAIVKGGPRPRQGKKTTALPWFIVIFAVLSAARSFGGVDDTVSALSGVASTALTALAMAALGLLVDLKVVVRAGSRVSMTAIFSIIVIGLLALALIHLLRLT